MDSEGLKKRHILAMKLLGISSPTIAHTRGTSMATLSRDIQLAIKDVAGESFTEKFRNISTRKNTVKHSAFKKIKDMKQARDVINKALTTNSCNYSSILWFGDIVKGSSKVISPAYERIYCPKDPSNKMTYQTPYAPRPDNKINERLSNMTLVLKLLNWVEQDINLFTNRLKFEGQLFDQEIDPHTQSDYKLLRIAPQYPATRKQTSKHLLISFAIKHLERDPSSFIYVQKFEVNKKELKVNDGKIIENKSWWVYGQKNILDWFECY